jgi:hypothetical protein
MLRPATPAWHDDLALTSGGGPGAVRAALATLARIPTVPVDALPEAGVPHAEAAIAERNLREALAEVPVVVLAVHERNVMFGGLPVLQGATPVHLAAAGVREVHVWAGVPAGEVRALLGLLVTRWAECDAPREAFLEALHRAALTHVTFAAEARSTRREEETGPVLPVALPSVGRERVRAVHGRPPTAPAVLRHVPVSAPPAPRSSAVPEELADASVLLADLVLRGVIERGPPLSGGASVFHRLADAWRSPTDHLQEALRDLVSDEEAGARLAAHLQRAELPRDAGWVFALAALLPASLMPLLARRLPPAYATILVDEVAARPDEADALLGELRSAVARAAVDPTVVFTIACAARSDDARLAEPLARLVSHPDASVRAAALEALRNWPGPPAREAATGASEDVDPRVRAAARRILAGAT